VTAGAQQQCRNEGLWFGNNHHGIFGINHHGISVC
jgi:hypothetical protein